MKELLEAGVHFGHQTKRWNPKMKEFIFGERNGIYIIDLQKTLKMFKEASKFIADLSADGKTVLFVGTKRQAQDAIAEEATRAGAFYVNQRWLGGLLRGGGSGSRDADGAGRRQRGGTRTRTVQGKRKKNKKGNGARRAGRKRGGRGSGGGKQRRRRKTIE